MARDLTRAEKRRAIERDRSRCLRCGRRPATFQHRRAIGMSGVGPTDLTLADGVALCLDCNVRAERDLQQEALERGWKVRRFSHVACTEIPYYDALTGNWWLPDAVGGREWIDEERAGVMIRAALAD